MTKKELKDILKKHEKWLNDEEGGEQANLRNVDLSNVDLRYADLSNVDLRYADLSNVNLRYANLSNADLRYADLSYADLRYANLIDTDLINANLINADLRYADLSNANLRYANLRYADLRYANLRNANLKNTTIWGTSFFGVIGKKIISIQLDTSQENRVINYIPEIDWVSAGCFHGTLEELKKRVKITHRNNEKIRNRYLKAIKFIKEIAKDYEK